LTRGEHLRGPVRSTASTTPHFLHEGSLCMCGELSSRGHHRQFAPELSEPEGVDQQPFIRSGLGAGADPVQEVSTEPVSSVVSRASRQRSRRSAESSRAGFRMTVDPEAVDLPWLARHRAAPDAPPPLYDHPPPERRRTGQRPSRSPPPGPRRSEPPCPPGAGTVRSRGEPA
jgi:hypothetical protein